MSKAVGEMSREELEKEVKEYRQRLDELEQTVEGLANNAVRRNQFNLLMSAMTGADFNDFGADPYEYRDAFEDFNDRLTETADTVKRHEDTIQKISQGDSSSPEGHWLNTIRAAENLKGEGEHDLPDNRVRLFKENISQATGLGEKMASNYIETWGEEKQGTSWRPYQPPSHNNKGKARRKRLVVDLNVWGDVDA